MKKQIISVTLVLCILLGFTPAISVNVIAETSGVCGENLTWSIDAGILTISGTGAMYDLYTQLDGMWVDKNLNWPNGVQSIIISEGVTSIGKEAFSGMLGLENISISNTVTTIKDNAFLGCSELRSIVIPSSVEKIGAGVFARCENLTSIIVDEGNLTYTADEYALYTKDKTELVQYIPGLRETLFEISNSVKTISEQAFRMTYIYDVVIPDSVTEIGLAAFLQCSLLQGITVDKNNSVYSDIGGVLFNKEQTILISYPMGWTEDYVVPQTVKIIEDSAFHESFCENIILNEGLEEIRQGAFGSSRLTDIYIPASVKNIGKECFVNSNLQKITVDEANEVYCSVNGSLYDKNVTTLIAYPVYGGSVCVIPDGVKTLSECSMLAFSAGIYCLIIPETLEEIGNDVAVWVEKVLYKGTKEEFEKIELNNNWRWIEWMKESDIIYEYDNELAEIKVNECFYDTDSVILSLEINYILEDFLMIVGIYDQNDRLVKCHSRYITVEDVLENPLSNRAEFYECIKTEEIAENYEDYKVKIFLWKDFSNIKTIGKFAPVAISEYQY